MLLCLHRLEDLIEQRQQLHVILLVEAGAAEDALYVAARFLDDMRAVGDQERAHAGAADDQHLFRQRFDDDADVAAENDVAAEDAEEDSEQSDGGEHGHTRLLGREFVLQNCGKQMVCQMKLTHRLGSCTAVCTRYFL
jgi:hypothetical protein